MSSAAASQGAGAAPGAAVTSDDADVTPGLTKHSDCPSDEAAKPHDPGGGGGGGGVDRRKKPLSSALLFTRQLSISLPESVSLGSDGPGAGPGSTSVTTYSGVPSIITELCEPDSTSADEVSGMSPASPSSPAIRPPSLPVGGVIDTSTPLMRKSPVTVQEWVDSIPAEPPLDPEPEDTLAEVEHVRFAQDICPTVTIRPADGLSCDTAAAAGQRRELFAREASPSLQSDTGSHASSVDSFLEAQRPDPEEVLLSLGFGGAVSSDAELSRIPSRFLKPSKVKGININDFLRSQQDMIDTFEYGFCGYRGLTGGSQIPSGIVSKIMEKLRESERENSVKSSGHSGPGRENGGRLRFTRAAQTVSLLTKMKSRDGGGGGGEQTRQTSVLNADNRKFLENQSSKSPEVPRRRMVIGQRSFTFDNKGEIVECEPTPATTPEISDSVDTPPSLTLSDHPGTKPPPPRPLEHKDSVLSSTTSQSLTSAESDSESETELPINQRYVRSQSYHPSASAKPPPFTLPSMEETLNLPNPKEVRRNSLPSAMEVAEIAETDGLRKRNVSGHEKDETGPGPARKAFKQCRRAGSISSFDFVTQSAGTTGSCSSVSSLSSLEAGRGTSGHNNNRRGSLKRQQNVVEEDEAIADGAEAVRELNGNGLNQETKKQLDFSGFQEDVMSSSQRLRQPRSRLTKQLSGSEPLICPHAGAECQQFLVADNLKRLSLPVIRIWDEWGPTLWRTKKCCHLVLRTHPGIRRWHSLPSQLSRVVRIRDLPSPPGCAGSVSDSRSNVFSSCSDESVIHVNALSADLDGDLAHPDKSRFVCPSTAANVTGSDEEQSDEEPTFPASFQKVGNLRVPISWAVTPTQTNSLESDNTLSNEHGDQLSDITHEPPDTTITKILDTFSKQNNLSHMDSVEQNFSLPPEFKELQSCHASTQTESSCRCGEVYENLLQENIRLQKVVTDNSRELARVRDLLETILAKNGTTKSDEGT